MKTSSAFDEAIVYALQMCCGSMCWSWRHFFSEINISHLRSLQNAPQKRVSKLNSYIEKLFSLSFASDFDEINLDQKNEINRRQGTEIAILEMESFTAENSQRRGKLAKD